MTKACSVRKIENFYEKDHRETAIVKHKRKVAGKEKGKVEIKIVSDLRPFGALKKTLLAITT